MPHKVHRFFDPHAIIPSYFHEPKKTSIQRSPEDGPVLGNRTPSISSLSSHDSNEKNAKIPSSHMKRLAKHMRAASSADALQHVPANLKITMESPPVVFYGQPETSSGALLSGQLKLYITEGNMVIKDFSMKFFLERTYKRPFHHNCADCRTVTTELASWDFVHAAAKAKKGEQSFPFSHLLKGDLPASMDGPLGTIVYKFHAVAVSVSGEKTVLDYILPVKRAIQGSENPRQSIRIFPPTTLTAHVDLPTVIHPIGEAKATMRIDGIVKPEGESKRQRFWRLQRMSWRLEENHKSFSRACPKHAAKITAKAGEEPVTYLTQQDQKTIGNAELKSGWKSDYSSADGKVEIEFPFSVNPAAGACCDLEDDLNFKITHQLVVELVVGEEESPNKRPQHSTPTGAARILRMHFNIVLTERAGMGIAWDDEAPPVYENIPPSPPGYPCAEVLGYTGTGTPLASPVVTPLASPLINPAEPPATPPVSELPDYRI